MSALLRDSDLAAMLGQLGARCLATGKGALTALVEIGYQALDGGASVEIDGEFVRVTAITTDANRLGLLPGDPIEIDGRTYAVRNLQNQSDGTTVALLEWAE